MITKEWECDVERKTAGGERAVVMELEIGNKKVIFVSCYAPTAGNDVKYREVLQELLAQLVHERDDGKEIIIAGDMNVNENSTGVRKDIFGELKRKLELKEHRPDGGTFEYGDGKTSA